MPHTEIRVFRQADGRVPLQEWLDVLERQNPKAWRKCLAAILDLARDGYQLRRPQADYLRDGIYELRKRAGRVNYRILYAFLGNNVAVLTHGITKEQAVPDKEIEDAIAAMSDVKSDPEQFTAQFQV